MIRQKLESSTTDHTLHTRGTTERHPTQAHPTNQTYHGLNHFHPEGLYCRMAGGSNVNLCKAILRSRICPVSRRNKYGNEAAHAASGLLRGGSLADEYVFQSFVRISFVMFSHRKMWFYLPRVSRL